MMRIINDIMNFIHENTEKYLIALLAILAAVIIIGLILLAGFSIFLGLTKLAGSIGGSII